MEKSKKMLGVIIAAAGTALLLTVNVIEIKKRDAAFAEYKSMYVEPIVSKYSFSYMKDCQYYPIDNGSMLKGQLEAQTPMNSKEDFTIRFRGDLFPNKYDVQYPDPRVRYKASDGWDYFPTISCSIEDDGTHSYTISLAKSAGYNTISFDLEGSSTFIYHDNTSDENIKIAEGMKRDILMARDEFEEEVFGKKKA